MRLPWRKARRDRSNVRSTIRRVSDHSRAPNSSHAKPQLVRSAIGEVRSTVRYRPNALARRLIDRRVRRKYRDDLRAKGRVRDSGDRRHTHSRGGKGCAGPASRLRRACCRSNPIACDRAANRRRRRDTFRTKRLRLGGRLESTGSVRPIEMVNDKLCSERSVDASASPSPSAMRVDRALSRTA